MPRRWRSARSSLPQRRPSTSTSPASGASRPSRISTVVVLPAPLGPSRPKHSPRAHLEVEPVHGDDVVVALHEPAAADGGRGPAGGRRVGHFIAPIGVGRRRKWRQGGMVPAHGSFFRITISGSRNSAGGTQPARLAEAGGHGRSRRGPPAGAGRSPRARTLLGMVEEALVVGRGEDQPGRAVRRVAGGRLREAVGAAPSRARAWAPRAARRPEERGRVAGTVGDEVDRLARRHRALQPALGLPRASPRRRGAPAARWPARRGRPPAARVRRRARGGGRGQGERGQPGRGRQQRAPGSAGPGGRSWPPGGTA